MEKTVKIGSFLKNKREDQKLSINDVSSKTKINLNILKHLEANDLDQLPNKTYVKGFVKSYCKLLGLDINEAISLLEKTYKPVVKVNENKVQATQEVQKQTPPIPAQQTNNNDNINEIQDKLIAIAQSIFNKKIMLPIIILCIVAIILKGIVTFFVQLSDEQKELAANNTEAEKIIKTQEVEAPKVDDTKPIIQDPTIKEAHENLFDSEANKKLKAQIIADNLAPKKEEKEIAEVKAVIKKKKYTNLNGKFPFKKFYPAPVKMYQILDDATENQNTVLLPTRFKNAIEDGKQNIYIHATSGDTWISYQSDEDDIKRFVLKKGRSILIKGDIVLLFLGNINVAHIFYNNKLIKTHSKTGVKSLIFPQIKASGYQLPLFPAYNGVPFKASEYKANMASE